MILLDKNSYQLLDYLLKLEEPETVMAISRAISQSRRKIYYHLDKINEALPAEVSPVVSVPRVGILLTDQQKAACQVLLQEIDDYSYIMSIEERVQLALVCIAVSQERITIEKLMQINDVSRNTILNDLHEIRNRLTIEQYSIQLGVTKSRGYYLDCHPLSKIQYIYRLLSQIYAEGTNNFIALTEERVGNLIGPDTYFQPELLARLDEEIRTIQTSLGKKINSQDVQFLLKVLPYLLMCYRNIPLTDEERKAIRKDFVLAQERKEYTLAQQLAQRLLEQFDLSLDEIEMSIIAMLLLSYRKDSDSHIFSQDYDELRQTLERFIAYLEQVCKQSFVQREELTDRLMVHCKALLFRKTYGILSLNPLTAQIKDSYRTLFEKVSQAAFILEEAWQTQLTADELAYITIHIGGALELEQLEEPSAARLVLVCDDGVGLQKLLVSQCRRYLPDNEIEAVFTTEQFDSVADLLQIDCLISTNDSLETDLPFLVVNPVLTDEDVIKLLRFTKLKGRLGLDPFDEELDQIIRQHVKDSQEAQLLKTKIEKLISQKLLTDFVQTDK